MKEDGLDAIKSLQLSLQQLLMLREMNVQQHLLYQNQIKMFYNIETNKTIICGYP